MIETIKLCFHITRRNWVVYKKDFIANISPTISDPMFSMFSLGIGLGAMIPTLGGKSYLVFLAPGLTGATALFTSFFECSYGFFIRLTFENVFKAMLTTPIGVREIILGEYLWVGLKGAVMTIGVSLVFAAFGVLPHPLTIPLIGAVGFLVAVGCGALGLISGALVNNINQFQTVFAWVISPLYFLSGIFFPLERMPVALQVTAYCFPLAHGVKLIQLIFWNELTLKASLFHGSIMMGQCLLLGGIAYHFAAKKLRP